MWTYQYLATGYIAKQPTTYNHLNPGTHPNQIKNSNHGQVDTAENDGPKLNKAGQELFQQIIDRFLFIRGLLILKYYERD